MPDRYAEARGRMVAGIAERWKVPDAVLAAIAAVPREAFAPLFFDAVAPGSVETREFAATADAAQDVIDRVYDPDLALGLARRAGRVTSTISAPGLLASMIGLLGLEPGMRVLEIGAGSGYTAALLAEVVGDPGLVTTIDIDDQLVERAGRTLAGTGYDAIHIECVDGALGVARRAPFDRIIATVGCTDLAPAWFEQLSADGLMLIPLQHGGVHPLFRAGLSDGIRTGRVVGRSGFVYIQGHQADARSPWPFTRVDAKGPFTQAEIPGGLGERFAVETGRARLGSLSLWEFSFYLSLVDRRTSRLGMLADETRSVAMIHGTGVVHNGANGAALAEALVGHLEAWVGRGSPGSSGFANRFVPGPAGEASDGPDVWTIDRVDHHQVVQLEPDA